MKTISTLFLMLAYQLGLAQHVSGLIYTSDLKRAAFASVQLTHGADKHELRTDAYGEFEAKVAAGSWTLRVAAPGHLDHEQILEIGRDHSLQVVVYLIPSLTNLQGVRISSVRAGERSPSTAVTLDKEQLIQLDQSKDIPFLLDLTPATVISSDAGNGIGYTGVRIRGIDPTRVNVTINDVPLNDAESQGVFWVDLPDLGSTTHSIQVQRGVGTSTNGVAAFGASINIETDELPSQRNLSQSLAFGSFGTERVTVQMGSGERAGGWNVQGRLSHINSDGFIDRASSSLWSAQLNVRKSWRHSSIQANAMLGHERTYQAWWGIPQPKFDNDPAAVDQYISNLWMNSKDSANLKQSDPWTYNYYTYENEVDDYGQNHLQIIGKHHFNAHSHIKATLHYTRGLGYFEQYATPDQLWIEGLDLSSFGIAPYVVDGDTLYSTDLVRRRWLNNHYYGGIVNHHWNTPLFELVTGGGWNQYLGRHLGEAIQTLWTGSPLTDYEAINATYYDEDATKNDLNLYAKGSFRWGALFPYVDLQYRRVEYSYLGYGETGLERGRQEVTYNFFNPKVGLSYMPSARFKAAIFFGIGQREPIRSDFVDSRPGTRPKPEQMRDLEMNLRYSQSSFQMDLTLYNMAYRNALVLNGQINDVGAYTRVNVDRAHRRGIECAFATPILKILELGGNLNVSDNRIASFTEYVDDWYVGGQQQFEYTNTAMALSPSVVAAGHLSLSVSRDLQLRFTSKYVGRQFLDNTESTLRSLPAFQYMNAQIGYVFPSVNWAREVGVDLYLNNIGNARYAPSGYTFSGILEDRADFNYVYPMAGFNWMFKLRMAF